MSAKILQFKPRPGNKLYSQPSEKFVIQNKISYVECLKIPKTAFTTQELKGLSNLGFFYDQQYEACYPDNQNFETELIEKRGSNYFYLEVLPFNIYPSTYIHFESFSELLLYLKDYRPWAG